MSPEAPLNPESDHPSLLARSLAGRYASQRQAFERGLVVLAIGRAVWVESDEQGWSVLVEPEAAEEAREELALFDREQLHWPPREMPDLTPAAPGPFFTPLLWAAAVLGVFWLQGRFPGLVEWGALDAIAVFQRQEAWRPLTALFLHADGAHLLANGLSGIFAFSAVLSVWGRNRGWAALLLAAVAGNVAALAIHSAGSYRSIGASTAVFAALGLLAGHAAVRIARQPKARWRVIIRPLASALVVLGLFGAGGQNIDVIAHATGFGAGLLLGGLWRRPAAPRSQEAVP